MKKIISCLFFIGFSSASYAAPVEYFSLDDSKESAVCMASTVSNIAMKKMINRFGMSTYHASKIKCNDIPLKEFGVNARSSLKYVSGEDTNTVFVFDKGVDSVETQLCIAAATSNDAWNKVVADFGTGTSINKQTLRCNGMDVSHFAQKFGNHLFQS